MRSRYHGNWRRKRRDFTCTMNDFYCRTKYGILFIPDIEMRENVLKVLHDQVGHWDFNSSYQFGGSRFWWPNMRQEIATFVNSCDICQKTKPANRKEIVGMISLSGKFHTWSKDLAWPFPRTNAWNQYLIVAVEQMSKWAVAWVIPAELFNSMPVMEFVKKEIIMLLGPPQFAPSGNDLKFDCKAMQDFARRFNITWKDKSTYNPQGNSLVERIIVILEKGLQKSPAVNQRSRTSPLKMCFLGSVEAFEILFVIKPRFAMEPPALDPGEEL